MAHAATLNKSEDATGAKLFHPPSFGGEIQLEDEEPDLHWRSWVVLGACGFYYGGTLIVLLSTGFWLQVIEADIGGAAIGLWLSQSYNVVNAVLGPIAGQVGDTCGRRYVMLFGIAMGMVGVAIIATAKTMNVAILGASLYGLDWMLVGNGFSIASEVMTRRWRTRAQSFMNVCGSTGIIVAVFAGAGFIENQPGGYTGWRSCFWFAFAALGTCFILFAVFYFPAPPPNPNGLSVTRRLMNCDWVGAAIFGAALGTFLLGLIWGGVSYPWKSAHVLSPLLIGIALLVTFALHQTYIKRDGLVPVSMIKKRNVYVSLFATAVEGMIYITFNQYYGEETAILWEARTYFLALRFSTFLFGNIFGSAFVQWYSYRYKRVKLLIFIGFALFLVGVIGLAASNEKSSKIAIFWSTIMGFGFSAPIAMLISVAQLAVEPNEIGLITGLLISARSVGGAIGVAIATAVWTSKLEVALPEYIAEAALAAGLPATSLPQFVGGIATNNITLAESAPGVNVAILQAGGAAAIRAYAFSLKYIWIVIIPFTIVAMVACVFLHPIYKTMNYIVDRPAEAIVHDHALDQEKVAAARAARGQGENIGADDDDKATYQMHERA